MTLLAPWALWLLGVVPVVVALYLLKLRRTRETVPSLEFWRNLAGPTQVRSLFRRLKRLLSLLLWLLIVACLLLAVGNPIFSLGRMKPRSIAIVLDNSASMQALEPDATNADAPPRRRLELAIDAIRDITERRPVSDEWLLIDAGRQTRVAQPWTRERGRIAEAAMSIAPFPGGVELDSAIELATQLLEDKERPCILVVTDATNVSAASGAPRTTTAAAPSDAPEIIVHRVGATSDNVGITTIEARPHTHELSHYVFVRITSASEETIESQLVLSLDESTRGVEPFTIEPGGVWEKTIVIDEPLGGVLKATIDRADALMTDNVAYAILPPIKPASVLLVSTPDQAYFFQQALVAMEPLVDLDTSVTITPAEYGSLGGDAKSGFDVTIFNGEAPDGATGAEAAVFVNTWPEGFPLRRTGSIDLPALSIVDRDHPLCRYVSLGGAELAQAQRVEPLEPMEVLAVAGDGAPLMLWRVSPKQTALCIAFSVMESDLPFRNAFPLILRNAVIELAASRKRYIKSSYGIGERIVSLRPVSSEQTSIKVGRPGATQAVEESEIAVNHGGFDFDAGLRPGPLRIQLDGDFDYAAVNLASDNETRLAPMKASADAPALELTDRLFGVVPWFALAIAATLLILFEWMSYHFRWTE
ncbi:MAG: VWA domain-containing protein [Phycisphaerales bacterium]|nr:VWA domain-containing protein [Phycisphaerales bacterium]